MIVWQGVVPGKKAYRVRDWRGGGAGLPAFGGESGAEAEPRKARWHKVPHPLKFKWNFLC